MVHRIGRPFAALLSLSTASCATQHESDEAPSPDDEQNELSATTVVPSAPLLHAPCETPALVSSECGDIVGGPSRACMRIADNPPFCASMDDLCPAGTVKFGTPGPCLVACTPGADDACPAPFSKCQRIYPDWSDTPAFCVP
jgi:hypothetical protein